MTGWTDLIGWTLVHFLWQGTLIAVVTGAVLGGLHRASAHVRYGVACAGLFIALVAPPATMIVLATGGTSQPTESVRAVATSFQSPRSALIGTLLGSGQGETASTRPGIPLIGDRAVTAVLPALVAFWVAGVLLLTARLASGWWRVRQLHADALAAPASDWLATAAHLARTLRLPRAIHVVDSLQVDTPTVVGWLRPVVLMPVAALANLTPSQVEAILAHELAHIRRHDFVVNLLQTVAETVLFYHPAVWWLSGRIRTEREHCCDDIAVEICGDPVGYAEALTALAAWGRLHAADGPLAQHAPLAVAATGGSLLHRVRRLLRISDDRAGHRPAMPIVLAATVLIILLVGTRLAIVAQTPEPSSVAHTSSRFGPPDVNRLLGFELLPGRVHYVTDDPEGARAWDVKVAFPEGEMAFRGFTGRGLVRYAFGLDAGVPVMEGPSWIDTESLTIRGETSAEQPTDEDYRAAIRVVLEGQYGMAIRREAHLFPVYGLQVSEKGRLGPNIRPSETECFDSNRDRLDTIGPRLHERGQHMLFCGVDSTLRGPRGYRVTLAEFARSLRGFNMGPVDQDAAAREVVDQTGLTGVYDFELNLGFLPLAAIASAHPTLALGFGPMIRTFPQAIEEQLGLRLVPSEALRDVAVIATARQALASKAAQLTAELGAQRPER